jgi:D-alanine-D-alanine ligase-like ATP-grasp enzyme
LVDTCKKAYLALGLKGHCRIDVRSNSKNEVFLLDPNSPPGSFYPPSTPGSVDKILFKSKVWNHEKFLNYIVDTAIYHYEKKHFLPYKISKD